MKKILSIFNSTILTSATESWLSFGSVFMNFYPKCIFLGALGLLFLYLRYRIQKFYLPKQTSQGIRKQQGRAKKEKRTSFNEFRNLHGEAREWRKLQSVVQSPRGQLYDPSYFRQVLCPNPSCDVCDGASVKVKRLLSWASLEDCSASVSSMASTASVTETSFTPSSSLSPSLSGYQTSSFSFAPSPPPPSVLSTNELASWEDILLCTPQVDSLPPEPAFAGAGFPLDHILPYPLSHSPSVAQPATQQTGGLLRLEETIQSLAGSHGDLFLDATTSHAFLESSQQSGGIYNSSPPQSKCSVSQEIPNHHHSPEDFGGRQASPHFPVPEDLLKILERQEESQADVLVSKDREGEAEPFQKALAVWEKRSQPSAELQNSEDSFPLGGSRAILRELNALQGLAQVQTAEGQLEATPSQHFWGLPYLHSESMSCITTVSSHCSSMCIWFNRATDSPALAPPAPLSLPDRHTQTLTQTQSGSIHLATAQSQLQPMPMLSPSSQSQVRVCGMYFRSSQEMKTLLQPEIPYLEYNMMAREQERAWALPSVVQKSQEKVCLLPAKPSLAIQAFKIQTPRSVPPRDFPLTDGFQKKFEQHLRKRFILQRWGLPQGIYKSQLWVNPDPPESSWSSHGRSGLKHEDHKEPPKPPVLNQAGSPQERCSGSVSTERKPVKVQEQTVEIIQKYLCSNSKSALDNGLPSSDQEMNLQGRSSSLSDKPSETSQVSQFRKKFEAAPQEHLRGHIDGTNEDQVPVTVPKLGHRPLHFNSCVGKKEIGAETQPPPENKDEHTKSTQRIAMSAVQQTAVVLDTTSLEVSEGKRHSPKVPKMLVEAGPVPLGKSLSSSKIIQGPQGSKMDDKNIFVSNKVSNLVREQLSGLHPQPIKMLSTSQSEHSEEADGSTSTTQSSILFFGRVPEERSGPQESQASDFIYQVFRKEKFKSEGSQPILAPEPPKDELPVLDIFTYKTLPVHDQSPSSAPMNAAQVEQQEPWVPPHALGKGLNKDTPLSAKRLSPAPRKTEELGAGGAGPETLQPDGKDSPTQGNSGRRPIPSLPGKALSPPEHQFRKHVKHFFQWLSPDKKCKGQEALLKRDASPSLSVPANDPELKVKATSPGNTVAQKVTRDFGKVPKEQLGQRHGASDTLRPRVASSPPTKPVKTKPKKEYWVPTAQGRQFQHPAPFSKLPSQATAFVGQKRGVAERARQPQKCEALQPRPPGSHRESELRPNLLLSRAGKVPRGTPPFAVGTMLADMSRLCEQKILAQNFSGKDFVPQK
ncbi:similar to hypothetical protein 4932411G14 (predicted) [Rattus norvegicus]|uniref:SPATA31 subfamily D member 1 n=2 Tax=Rattus norvegicus TaxID=10116 RepID=D3ZM38_RAT|nr:SPATA31 subfamily D member 1 [Rattus norvegicus]EDL93881.1 similar to hypothetical protein 4932411G14 (predicted) [Rattus norvegicus]|eukprot:NP_001128078.1 SPATA31 subfamily D member 1 [Rattus norvegicus]